MPIPASSGLDIWPPLLQAAVRHLCHAIPVALKAASLAPLKASVVVQVVLVGQKGRVNGAAGGEA